jgi:hypothetical protein
MYALGIDPDTKTPAYALLNLVSGRISYVGIVKATGTKIEERLISLSAAVAAEMRKTLCNIVEVCAVEWQAIRPGQDRRPNDILNLATVSGMCSAAVSAHCPNVRMLHPQPYEWKKGVPKPIHQKRILVKSDLLLGARGVLTQDGGIVPGSDYLTATQRGHVIDAIGLARYAAGY